MKNKYYKHHRYFNKDITNLSKYEQFVKKCHFGISESWAKKFTDIHKLRFLDYAISQRRNRKGMNTKQYQAFVEYFYNDTQFNVLYNRWQDDGRKNKYLKPSLDHIVPISKGGKVNDIENLQFLTYMENICKSDMSQHQWNIIKKDIEKYFI